MVYRKYHQFHPKNTVTSGFKWCYKCDEVKPIALFNKNKAKVDGLSDECRECVRQYKKANRAKLLIAEKRYRLAHPEMKREADKRYAAKNQDKIKQYKREWEKRNRERVNKQKNDYQKERRKNDPNFLILNNTRARIKMAIKNNYDTPGNADIIGCSIPEMKRHIESLFRDGMTWDNYCKDGWELDHIKPLCLFDLTDRKQFLKAFHYTNVQPLWHNENKEKGSKYA